MDSDVRIVMHGHNARLWRRLVERGPASHGDVAYGTPAMAREVAFGTNLADALNSLDFN
jgi:hypothetical protein